MPSHLTITEEKKQKPTLLFVDTNSGQSNILLNLLIEKLEKDTQVYALTNKKVNANVKKISPLSVHFLDKLSGELSYTVIFLDEEKQKKKVLSILELFNGTKTKVVLLIPYRIYSLFVDVLIQSKEAKNVTVGFLGDMFGISSPAAPVSKIIDSALRDHEIVVSENHLFSLFPISDTDAVSGVSHLLFSRHGSDQFFYLFYLAPQTITSLAHILKRIEPDLAITFQKNAKVRLQSKTQEQMGRNIRDRIGVLPGRPNSSFIGFEKSVVLLQETLSGKTRTKVKRRSALPLNKTIFSKMFVVMRLFFISILLYVLIIGGLFFTGIFFYKQGVSALTVGDIEQAKSSFQSSRVLYSVTHSSVSTFLSLAPVPISSVLRENLDAYDDLMAITDDVLKSAESIKNAHPHIEQKKFQTFVNASLQLYFLSQRYNVPSFKNIIKSEGYQRMSRFLPLSEVLLSALGYDQPKTYLLLFQNNNELRPTGGFIGSVGEMTLKNGSIENIKLQDVYDLDGQLKGHLDPPFIVRRFLQPHLYLRDSNFELNFEDSASMSAFLYNLEGGKRVDGVIAVDTEVLKKIVHIAGPLQIPGNSKEITEENVLDILQDTISSNNFPGSSEKKQLLQTIFSKITLSFDADNKKFLSILQDLPTLVLQKHILFSFTDSATQKAFVAAGFAGNTSDLRISQNTLSDFLAVNEANIGVNKANKLLTRKITYSAFLKPGALDHDALLEYANAGVSDYKAYIRLVVPKGAKLLSITLDGVEQKIVPAITNPLLYERKGFQPPVGLEVNQEKDALHTVFGFLVVVPHENSKRIHILYETGGIVPAEGSFKYSLLYIKQPGTLQYPLTVQVQADSAFQVDNPHEMLGPVLFDGTLSTDSEFTANIVRVSQ